jgi:hypothetical protein
LIFRLFLAFSAGDERAVDRSIFTSRFFGRAGLLRIGQKTLVPPALFTKKTAG